MKKILKFEKTDCNPCVQVSTYLNERKVDFETINAFDNPDAAAKYKVRTLPTTVAVVDDEVVGRVIGFKPSELDKLIELQNHYL